ncbi:toll/interleukin-1 receptor domain-containing adapter protein isoform X1 [Herpailurus yagouaroundi]|uniref:toll/interleukin-1 receptor domain-containing adapter protein isoform X1 n=1 Tax=Herpailurus yagouaroundi TaxID=1608482 RepID=UPI001AD7B18E|nr:toll/interleukin-1 receptor domain-containing adapter protein isoform X1 [Puma yagouaroundi]XP_040339416.1 toll/interleukin-1 receptor domain-containing adapter protein isoform X1 [Puma yagouaroundi]XP_040339417.1 toll/interleukin-1 receptor domain-containing adapter protein isoform X1 [Puma yagouaroundi]XP_040339418.1 toll/interleukin-1 receptor domain-containing adapter protein isoform X1 [Puma yagouaroundi]XP_040339419.1 toll/interleukin-1 receptor domain-containing adapter protein isofor
MASSTSSAPRSRSRKPLGKMADWFRQALSKKPKKILESSDGPSSDVSQPSSQDHPPRLGLSSTSSPTHVVASSSDSSSGSSGRWSKDYDVCVCHSEEDLAAAQELVSYLEGSTASLRCFLQLRDATPGGAIVSELCQALSNSHCRVLLITPGFLQDPWCKYQMLQALSEAPGAEGRTIPLMSGLARAAYPAELRFMYFVDGRGPDGGFRQVKEAVMRCKLLGICRPSADTSITMGPRKLEQSRKIELESPGSHRVLDFGSCDEVDVVHFRNLHERCIQCCPEFLLHVSLRHI